ncbi:MAG: type II secretion system protein [Elusimicrobia bacterium]|nr:type II secretion system protein [Elusimicrobiota bacterium]
MILAIGRKSKRNKKGFTLIELVLVMSIMMVLALLAMPGFNKIYIDSKLKSSTQTVTWVLRYAYQAAISEGVRYRAHFDLSAGTYWLEKQENGAGLSNFNKINTALLKEKNLPEGITFKKAEPPAITMSPTGLGESACIYLTNSNGRVYTIVFSGLTGQVTVLDHEKQ